LRGGAITGYNTSKFMLWQPTTDGEDLFLRLFEGLGNHLALRGPDDAGLGFLVAPSRFTEFARLTATLEVFLRCIGHAKAFHQDQAHMPSTTLGAILGKELDLPARLARDRRFCESAKRAGANAATRPRSKAIERTVVSEEPPYCYLCAIHLTKTQGAPDQRTIEHLWPLSLGGDSSEGNLTLACKHCNDTRQHCITWAWGPVQSTYHARSGDDDPPRDLRLSLALARMMLVAAGTDSSARRLTLKEAARTSGPGFPSLTLADNRHYVYFELFAQVEARL